MERTTYDTPGALRLEVRLLSGDVSIQAAATSTTSLEISGENDPDEISVAFESSENDHRLSIEHRKRGIFGGIKGRNIKVRVTVPEGTHVRVDGGSTDLTARGTLGSLSFHSGSGDASVQKVVGDAEAKVASGDLHIDQVNGKLSFHSASGDVSASVVGGEAIARTASGDVALGKVGGSVRVTTVSGDISVSSLLPTGSANLQAVSGDIDVGVPTGTNVYLDLSSSTGSTRSDLTVSDSPPASADVPDESEIRAATVSGDITVHRSRQ